MITFCVNQWDKNKDRLKSDIENNIKWYSQAEYADLVRKVVDFVFNDEDEYSTKYDSKNITEIDNGDYQGTLMYVIPEDSYQPSEDEYLMTYVGYGSCSGCDTLQSIQKWSYYEEDNEEERKEEVEQFTKDVLDLCLHIVQNTIKPYNHGWREDERFKFAEDIDNEKQDEDDFLF